MKRLTVFGFCLLVQKGFQSTADESIVRKTSVPYGDMNILYLRQNKHDQQPWPIRFSPILNKKHFHAVVYVLQTSHQVVTGTGSAGRNIHHHHDEGGYMIEEGADKQRPNIYTTKQCSFSKWSQFVKESFKSAFIWMLIQITRIVQ